MNISFGNSSGSGEERLSDLLDLKDEERERTEMFKFFTCGQGRR